MKQSHLGRGARVRFFILLLAVLWCRAALAAPETATINGAPISYEVCGDPKAQGLVLAHDGLLNSAAWDFIWPTLCESYRTVRYDRRGYGLSPPARTQHSPADDLWGVMRQAGLSHAHIVAGSTGAHVALEFLFEYPEAIDKLIFVSPSLSGFKPSEAFLARLSGLEAVIRGGDIKAVLKAFQADPHFLAPHSGVARAKFAAILEANPGDLGAHPLQTRTSNLRARLGEVYAPALIVVGSLDDPYTQSVASAMQQEMRAARLHLMLEAGQLVYLDQPATFVGMVRAFLK